MSTVTAIPNCFLVSFWFCSIANAAHISSFLQFPISQLFIPIPVLDHPIVNTKVQMKINKLFKSSMINFHFTALQSFD